LISYWIANFYQNRYVTLKRMKN